MMLPRGVLDPSRSTEQDHPLLSGELGLGLSGTSTFDLAITSAKHQNCDPQPNTRIGSHGSSQPRMCNRV
jgi:hypothetical protein